MMKITLKKALYLTFIFWPVIAFSSEDPKDQWVEWDKNDSVENQAKKILMSYTYMKNQSNPPHDFLVQEEKITNSHIGHKISSFSGTLVHQEDLHSQENASSPCESSREDTSVHFENYRPTHDVDPEGCEKILPNPKGEYEDTREIIRDPSKWPYRITGRLELWFDEKKYIGTGFLVGPAHVLTAGHNIFGREKGEDNQYHWMWASKIIFYPGYSENRPSAPFKPCQIYCKQGWVDQEKSVDARKVASGYDMALLVLKEPIGLQIGWGGLIAFNSFDQMTVKIHGYPASRWKGKGTKWGHNPISSQKTVIGAEEIPNKFMLTSSGAVLSEEGGVIVWTKWDNRTKENILYESNKLLLYYVLTSGGQSGSGVWLKTVGRFLDQDHYAIGVHTKALSEESNAGIFLTKEDLNNISDVIKKNIDFNSYSFEGFYEASGLLMFLNGLDNTQNSEDKMRISSNFLKEYYNNILKTNDLLEYKRFLFYTCFLQKFFSAQGFDGTVYYNAHACCVAIISNILNNQTTNLSDLFLYTLLGRKIIGDKTLFTHPSTSNSIKPKFFVNLNQTSHLYALNGVDLSVKTITQKFVELTGLPKTFYEKLDFSANLAQGIKELFDQNTGGGWQFKRKTSINLRGHKIDPRVLKSSRKIEFVLK